MFVEHSTRYPKYGLYPERMFSGRTLGGLAYPPLLGGRIRTIEPLQAGTAALLEDLIKPGIKIPQNMLTIQGLAETEIHEITPFLGGDLFMDTLRDLQGDLADFFTTRILYSPEDKFMGDLFERDLQQVLIEPGREPFRDRMLRELLLSLPERLYMLLVMKYGIDDGRPKRSEDVRLALGIENASRYRQLEGHAVSQARERKRDFRFLEQFLPVQG